MVSSARVIELCWPSRGAVAQVEAAEDAFIRRARAVGAEVSPLEVRRLDSWLPWARSNTGLFRVSWIRTRSLSILGQVRLSWARRESGVFIRHAARRVLMPIEGERAAAALKTLPEVEEMVVLEEKRIDPILAVRVADRWYEAYRWWKRPVLLPDDCPLLASD